MTRNKDAFLKRPCAHCPFRTDIPAYLTPQRVTEIERSVLREQQDFPCHKTIGYGQGAPDVDGEETDDTTKARRCAGMAILCEKLDRPTQMMRIEERLGYYDRTKMEMDAPVFDSFAAMRNAQRARRGER